MKKSKIILFGDNGQLGSRISQKLNELSYSVTSVNYPEIDFNKPAQLVSLIDKIQPSLIINAAAYTNVDQAENNFELAKNINGHAVGLIAKKANEYQAGFIHYSTDYVFNGKKSDLYNESDQPDPINAYGISKLLGETECTKTKGGFLIFRLCTVYSVNFPSFASNVLNWSRKNNTLRIVDDQVSNPTWATMIAEKTIHIINQYNDNWYKNFYQLKGIYHLANKGAVSRYEWAKAILALDPKKEEQIATQLLPAKSNDFPTPAVRPQFSGLDCTKFEDTFNTSLPEWRSSLIKALSEFN